MTFVLECLREKWIRFTHWEYWPIYIVYFPVSFYYLYLSFKARTLYFFSASNPSIETGGMFFESKWSIYQQIPSAYLPQTTLVKKEDSLASLIQTIDDLRLEFPMIVKPDRGERGWKVCKVHCLKDLCHYKDQHTFDFILQSYISYPIELSVFYVRHPENTQGKITSITQKEYLSVTGNGSSTLKELIYSKPRAFLQRKTLFELYAEEWNTVPSNGLTKILVPYGNHVRGALFLDRGYEIDAQLESVFDSMSKQIPDFYFGRFDLKCESISDLKEGKNFSIVELNGAGAEPAHIYDPNFSFWKAQKVLAQHYKYMFEIAKYNHEGGIAYMSHSEINRVKSEEREYKRMNNAVI